MTDATIAAMREQINDGNPMLRTLLGDQSRLITRKSASASTTGTALPELP